MTMESIRATTVIPASPERIYAAWVDGREHSRMTGGKATVVPRLGGRHTAWDGYIEARIRLLSRGRRIVMDWRTTDFPANAPDSRLEILLAPAPGGARITLIHANIPEGQGERYRKGWEEHYFAPMLKYFEGLAPPTKKKAAPKKKAPAKKAAPKKKAPPKKAAPKKKAPAKKAKATPSQRRK